MKVESGNWGAWILRTWSAMTASIFSYSLTSVYSLQPNMHALIAVKSLYAAISLQKHSSAYANFESLRKHWNVSAEILPHTDYWQRLVHVCLAAGYRRQTELSVLLIIIELICIVLICCFYLICMVYDHSHAAIYELFIIRCQSTGKSCCYNHIFWWSPVTRKSG